MAFVPGRKHQRQKAGAKAVTSTHFTFSVCTREFSFLTPATKTIPSMPAIWTSRPNGVRVFISVYDVAEHESESVRLEPWFYPGEEPDMQDEDTVRLYEDILRAVILGE